MKYFPLVWAGLWRKPVRTVLTMLSVVVAFLLFGLLQGFNQGLNSVVDNLDVDRLYISARSSMTDGLNATQAARIRAVPGVLAVSKWTFFGGYYQESRNPIAAFATDVEPLFQIYTDMKIRPEYIATMQRTRTGALVNQTLANRYGWQVGDRVPIGTSIWTRKDGSSIWEFDIVGTFDASAYGEGFPNFYINSDYFDEASSFGNGVVHYFLARIADPRQATQIAQAIDTLFENSPYETRTQTESAFVQLQLQQLGDIDFIVNAIVGAVLFTLLFLTANTMMQSVRERIPELAVLKTLGFSDGTVLSLVLVEALLLCVFAAAVGLAIASLLFPLLRAALAGLSMPPIVLAMGAAVAVMLAVISGLPPAWRAKRLNIVDALAGR